MTRKMDEKAAERIAKARGAKVFTSAVSCQVEEMADLVRQDPFARRAKISAKNDSQGGGGRSSSSQWRREQHPDSNSQGHAGHAGSRQN